VVNCVTGSAETIVKNAIALADAAGKSDGRVHIIHMSSMAIYGSLQGIVREHSVPGDGNWYGKAKVRAEEIFTEYAQGAGAATIFRIGCVYGARSALWV